MGGSVGGGVSGEWGRLVSASRSNESDGGVRRVSSRRGPRLRGANHYVKHCPELPRRIDRMPPSPRATGSSSRVWYQNDASFNTFSG